MMSTPFGPLPPPPPPVNTPAPPAEEPASTPADPAPATQTPPVVPPSGGADAGIRSLSPTTTATSPAEPDDSIIVDPRPMNPDDYATELTQTQEPDAWPWLQEKAASGQSLLPGMLMGVGVLFAIFVMMRHLRRKQANRPYIPPADDRIAAIHERATSTISPVERAMSDAEELARRLAATMENKAARLELLIEEADRKLEELNRAVAQASRAAPVPASPADRNGRPVRTIDPSLLDRARVEQDRAERNGHNGYHEPAAHSPPPMPHAGSTGVKQPAPNFPADPVHRRVWALADDGMPATDIARSLNQPVGQVELILNLRKSG
jgi:hypothetical protein